MIDPSRSCRGAKRRLLAWAAASVISVASLCPGIPAAQMLAHPNWAGNGMSTTAWWEHAVIYRVDSAGSGKPSASDLKYLLERINALRSLGVDAVLVPAPAIPEQHGSGATAQDSSALDELDDLVRAASSRGVRILLTLQPGQDQDLSAIARFWLNHGIAGFDLVAPAGATPEQNQASLELLRRVAAGAVGQRIVLSEVQAAPESQASSGTTQHRSAARQAHSSDLAPALRIERAPAQLQGITAASLRSMLQATSGNPNLIVELPDPRSAPGDSAPKQADVLAAIALTTHPAALISSDVHLVLPAASDQQATDAASEEPATAPKAPPQPPPGVYLPFKPYVPPSKNHPGSASDAQPSDPLTAWYQQLSALHHGEPAVRSGEPQYLDFDQQNAVVWVERAEKVSNLTPPVVVACNLSGSPVTLSLRSQLESLGLRGNYLRTLLRSDNAMGPQDLGSVIIPAHGVYVGELRR